MRDRVPVLGDLPVTSRLAPSETTKTEKKTRLVLIAPTVIDRWGNRLHSEDEMPFSQNAIPVQKPFTPRPK
jgi:type II secretory pathway component GspD/PulD (secretin)